MDNTYVYVDGFNFYYGAVRGTKFKWLNIAQLCNYLLPNNNIVKIKYFTALIKGRKHDPTQPLRQQVYLRALQTIPNLEIIKGHFLSHIVTLPLMKPIGKRKYVQVIKTEEKGSDVNIATHLLNDAFKDNFNTAVLITNDSDLLEPIKIVRNEFSKVVGILNPHKHPSKALLPHLDFHKKIRQGVLKVSQFPSTMKDKNGDQRQLKILITTIKIPYYF